MKRTEDSSSESYSERLKRLKSLTDATHFDRPAFNENDSGETGPKTPIASNGSDVLTPLVQEGLSSGKFGSVAKDIEAIFGHKKQISGMVSQSLERLVSGVSGVGKSPVKWSSKLAFPDNFIDLEDDNTVSETPTSKCKIITIDSEDEDEEDQDRFDERPSWPFQNAVSDQHSGATMVKDNKEVITSICGEIHGGVKEEIGTCSVGEQGDSTASVEDAGLYREVDSETKKDEDNTMVRDHENDKDNDEDINVGEKVDKDGDVIAVNEHGNDGTSVEDTNLSVEIEVEIKKDKGVYVGVEDEENHENSAENDGLEDIWNELSMGLELIKDSTANHSSDEQVSGDGKNHEHSLILKDDLGYVCRICGIIDRGIETIFDFQYGKAKSSRTYVRSQSSPGKDSNGVSALNSCDDDMTPKGIYAHPRHSKMMKPHQKEGFDFLASNLAGENPGGCILAHAPGSGKTFMIICFLQSFQAKYPNARPLIVLPKGIIPTWKKEFQTWQIEDFPLYDTKKDHNRVQHLEILKQWVEKRSVLFLSYQQFSSIVSDLDSGDVSMSCREILLKVPSILVLDEGHTPRNDNTDIFQAIAKMQTPRKVVLSGTLFQNHVKEVFNIIDLVRPSFLKTETSRSISNRIKSKVDLALSGVRRQLRASNDAAFFEIVEETLQKEKDFRRKVSIIRDLREMTSKVLHYYKGDFLDDLPGLDDFTVFLNLSSRQAREVKKVKKLPGNFKASSAGSAFYAHPELFPYAENGTTLTNDEMDTLLENLNVKDGVKAKFFLNILSLCEAKKEKLLVFSQYLLPLKFLERLAMKEKGWSLGKEIFVISGNSDQNVREWSMKQFNNSPSAKVFFGSIKACGEGISLVGASRIVIMDVHLNPSVTRQAIGRAFRPGQTRKVVVYRLVAADSPEVEDYKICSRKELISKTWFEWKECCGYKDFEVETVDVFVCGDEFLEGNTVLEKDIKVLYRR